MLDRMKKDLIALTLEINDLTESLRSKKQIFNDEANKRITARERKLQSNYRYQNLMKNIQHEMVKNSERITSLKTSIENKDETLQKRKERFSRQQAIAEAAKNDSKDTNEIKKRNNFMVQKLWSQFLKRKMEKEMQNYAAIEGAFQKIKQATGNTDVREMVNKFLQREQLYAVLRNEVSEKEQEYEKLKAENEIKQQRLH